MTAHEARELAEKSKPIFFEKTMNEVYAKISALANAGIDCCYDIINDDTGEIAKHLREYGYNVSVLGTTITKISW